MKTFVVVQQGGSSREMYTHVLDGMRQVNSYRKECDGVAYATSDPIEVPKAIIEAPEDVQMAVWGLLEDVAQAAAGMV